MSVNYIIKADIIDIKIDLPKADDSFLVDSNVWYWLQYPKASQSSGQPYRYQVQEYPNYIKKCDLKNNLLYRCSLVLVEVLNQIENTEREIFMKLQGISLNTKEFRHNYDSEWQQAVAQMKATWDAICIMSRNLDLLLDEKTADEALQNLDSCKIDMYDLFILKAMKTSKIDKIITDDGCFSTIPGIMVFTANKNILASAKIQGRLITR